MLITDIWNVVKQGRELGNAATWSNRTALTGLLISLITGAVAIAKAFGYDIPIDKDTIAGLAAGIVAVHGVVSAFLLVATDKRAGLPPKRGGDADSPPPT